jgi:hypothetical protein
VPSGYPARFESLYAEHQLLVRRQLAERGVAPADLDDVVQETFVLELDAALSGEADEPGVISVRAISSLAALDPATETAHA